MLGSVGSVSCYQWARTPSVPSSTGVSNIVKLPTGRLCIFVVAVMLSWSIARPITAIELPYAAFISNLGGVYSAGRECSTTIP